MSREVTAPRRLVDRDDALEALVDELASAGDLALDTEFHRERTYYPLLALVQIAWRGGIELIDPLAADVSILARLFEPGRVFVLHAAEQDLEVLERSCGTLPAEIFDTQLAAGFLGHSSPSLVNLIESLLGVRLHKGDQLTDWTRRPLAAGQLSYAAGDVAHLLELREVLSDRLGELGRLDWAREECSLLLGKRRGDGPPEEAWWRLPHSRQLRGQARGVAQEVAAWRERRAREKNLPLRFVLPDLALTSIAQRPPGSREELARTRGVETRHVGGAVADEVLAAIGRGRRLSAGELCLPEAQALERPNKPVVTLASAYATQRANELSLDPAVLATRADLVSFFQRRPGGRLTEGWRHRILGEGLSRLARGEAALAFDGEDGLVLEERSRRSLSAGA